MAEIVGPFGDPGLSIFIAKKGFGVETISEMVEIKVFNGFVGNFDIVIGEWFEDDLDDSALSEDPFDVFSLLIDNL